MKRWWWIGGGVAAILVLFGVVVAWQASRALDISKQQLRAERTIVFTLKPFAAERNTGFETVRSPKSSSSWVTFRTICTSPALLGFLNTA